MFIMYEMLQVMAKEVSITLAKVLLVLLAGIIAGKVVGVITRKVLEAIKVREGLEAINAEPTFLGMDIVDMISLFARWYTYLYFIIAALMLLNIPELAVFIEEVKALTVVVVEAIIVLYIGVQVANYVKRSLELYSKSPLIAIISYYFVLYLAAIFALTALYPKAAELLNYILLIIVGSLGFGLALGIGIAVGLGTKDLVAKVVSSYVKKR